MNNQYKLPLLNLTFDNPAELRRTKFLFITVLITTLTFAFLFVEALISSSAHQYIPITVIALLINIVALICLRLGFIKIVSNLFAWCIFGIATYSTLFIDQGLRSIAVVGYFALVPLSSLLFVNKKLNWITVASGTVFVVTYIGESRGWLTPIYGIQSDFGDVIVLLAVLSVTAVLQRVYKSIITQTTEDLIQANNELKASQEHLQSVYRELENRVAERTAELSAANENLRHEITLRVQADKRLRDREANLRKYNKALTGLTQSEALAHGDLKRVLEEVTETAARTLNIPRVSIWFHNKNMTKIQCWDLFEANDQRHSEGGELSIEDYPVYFNSLITTRAIAAVDAVKDYRTYELAKHYLKPLGIKSMLEAPIRRGAQVIGVLCNETVGETHHWTVEEENFVGSLADFITLATQLHEQRQIKEALHASEERYRLVAETAEDGIVAIDQESTITFVNPAMEKLFGYTAAELIGMPLVNLMPPNMRRHHQNSFNHYLKTSKKHINWQEVYVPGLRKDGQLIHIEISFGEYYSENQRFFTGIIRDVTERLAQEQALRESEERYRQMIESSPDGIYISQNEKVVYANQALVKILGADTAADLVGQECNTIIHPDAQAQLIQFKQAKEFSKPLPSTFLRVDGQPIDVEISLATIEYRGQPANQTFVRDLTERKRIEKMLQQTQKIESLGILAGGVAHDFNNLLVAMLGHTSLALRTISEESKAHRYVFKAMKAAERAGELTQQLLAYSGKGHFEVRLLNLNDLINENLHLFHVALPKHVHIETDFYQQLPSIEADTAQMQQIIMNLLLNAADAIGEHPGRVIVSTNVIEINQLSAENYLLDPQQPLTEGSYVRFTVTDNGIGIPQEVMSQIFDPFYTTKERGHGLGLAAVLGIVRGHGGGIHVESTPQHGTIFDLIFPISPKQISHPRPAVLETQASITNHDTTHSILIIDDEEAVRQTLVHILETEGIPTFEASNGLTGLELYKQNRDKIALVILDLSMPDMNGAEVFEKLRTENQQVPIMLSSGYSESEATRPFIGQGLADFLQKPYTTINLLNKIKPYLETV